jgi:hypothetical protein
MHSVVAEIYLDFQVLAFDLVVVSLILTFPIKQTFF